MKTKTKTALAAGAGALALLALAAVLAARPIVVGAIANGAVRSLHGPVPFDPAGDPDRAELDALGVTSQLRWESDSLSLLAWIVDPQIAPTSTVVVAHGIHDDMRDQLGTGRLLADAGYRAVLVDLRGHGRSEGEYLSYGVHESRDLARLADVLEDRDLLAGPLGAVGTSYGAATVLQWAGRDERVERVVAMCPFADLSQIVPRYVRINAPFFWRFIPGAWIAEGLEEAGTLASFDPHDARPVDAVGLSDARILFVHGADDVNIPPEHSRRMHEAIPDRSELIVIDGVGHFDIPLGSDDDLDSTVVEWLAPDPGDP